MFETHKSYEIKIPAEFNPPGIKCWNAVTLQGIRHTYILSYVVRQDDWSIGIDTLVYDPEFLVQAIAKFDPADITCIAVLDLSKMPAGKPELKIISKIYKLKTSFHPKRGFYFLTFKDESTLYDVNFQLADTDRETELVWERRV